MYISIKKLKSNTDRTRRLVVPDQTIKKKNQHGIISLCMHQHKHIFLSKTKKTHKHILVKVSPFNII